MTKEENDIETFILILKTIGFIFVFVGALTRNLAMVIAGIFLAIIK